jgi:Na+-translocating ferredoxin:NAD+ oxidoreductase RnfC subunit
MLIRAVLGRVLNPEEWPASQGVLVLNIQTVLAIYLAVCFDEKANSRFLTVADVDGRRGAVVKVPLGMRVCDMLDALRQACPSLSRSLNPARVFAGGGLMQAWHADASDRVDAAVNFVGSGRMPRFKESPQCSRCGRCGQVCPAQLPVADLVRLAAENRSEEVAALHPERCLSCGSCSLVCLAGMDLAGHMRHLVRPE